jgi:hypothetical protein
MIEANIVFETSDTFPGFVHQGNFVAYNRQRALGTDVDITLNGP